MFTGIYDKAGDGNRTHVTSLEGWCSTIEPRLQQNFHYITWVYWVCQGVLYYGSDKYPCPEGYGGLREGYHHRDTAYGCDERDSGP